MSQNNGSRKVAVALTDLVADGSVKFANATKRMDAPHKVVHQLGYLHSNMSIIAIAALAEAAIEVAKVESRANDWIDSPKAIAKGIRFVVDRETATLLRNGHGVFADQVTANAKREAASWFISNAPRWLAMLGMTEITRDELIEGLKLAGAHVELYTANGVQGGYIFEAPFKAQNDEVSAELVANYVRRLVKAASN